jgi:hypothetical protein
VHFSRSANKGQDKITSTHQTHVCIYTETIQKKQLYGDIVTYAKTFQKYLAEFHDNEYSSSVYTEQDVNLHQQCSSTPLNRIPKVTPHECLCVTNYLSFGDVNVCGHLQKCTPRFLRIAQGDVMYNGRRRAVFFPSLS